MILYTDLADYLTRQKILLKKTFAKLSIETNFSMSYLKRILSGEYLPKNRETLRILAKTFKVDYSTIVNLALNDKLNRMREKLLNKEKNN